MINLALLVFAAAAAIALSVMTLREHRSALRLRHGLLDAAAAMFPDSRITIARDQFPVLSASHPSEGQIRIELIADSMVCRRLPQLWVKVTLLRQAGSPCPTLGALARPTGAEFYSMVHDLPQWIEPPETGTSLLVRGDGHGTAGQMERVFSVFRQLFSQPTLKEVVITPRGIRVIRQAVQGDRGAHILLRQARFPLVQIAPELVREAIENAETLSRALEEHDLPVSIAA